MGKNRDFYIAKTIPMSYKYFLQWRRLTGFQKLALKPGGILAFFSQPLNQSCVLEFVLFLLGWYLMSIPIIT